MNNDPFRARESISRAQALVELRRFEEALPFVASAIAHDPGDAQSHCLLTQCLIELDRIEEALDSAQRAVAADPTSEWALRLLALARLRDFDADGAVEAATLAIAQAPWSAAGYMTLSDAELERGGFDAAEDAAREAIEAEPALSETHATLGRVMMRRGRWREAVDIFKHALSLDPENFAAMGNLSVSLRHRFRFGQALEAGAIAARLNPAHPFSRMNIAATLWALVAVVSIVVLIVLRILWDPLGQWISSLPPRGQAIMLALVVAAVVSFVVIAIRFVVRLPRPVRTVMRREIPEWLGGVGLMFIRGMVKLAKEIRETKATGVPKGAWVPSTKVHFFLGSVFTVLAVTAVAVITALADPIRRAEQGVGELIVGTIITTTLATLAGTVYRLGSLRRLEAGIPPTPFAVVLTGAVAIVFTLVSLGSFLDAADPETRADLGMFTIVMYIVLVTSVALWSWNAFRKTLRRRLKYDAAQKAAA